MSSFACEGREKRMNEVIFYKIYEKETRKRKKKKRKKATCWLEPSPSLWSTVNVRFKVHALAKP